MYTRYGERQPYHDLYNNYKSADITSLNTGRSLSGSATHDMLAAHVHIEAAPRKFEELFLLQSCFIGAHEVGVSRIIHSVDNMKFVVEELDAHGHQVGRNVFFVDVVEAVDFYAQRVKVGVRPELPVKIPLSLSTHLPSEMCISRKRKEVYVCGEVGLYNEAGGYGFVRPQNSHETVFFHVSNKRRVGWKPMLGEMVEFTLVYDKTRDRETACDIDICWSGESNRYTIGKTSGPLYPKKGKAPKQPHSVDVSGHTTHEYTRAAKHERGHDLHDHHRRQQR